MSGSNRIVIIGSSAAGTAAAREIRGKNEDAHVTLISDEAHAPYYRPFLTEYIGDRSVASKSNFRILTEEWCIEKKIDLRLNERITVIDPAKKIASSLSGAHYEYDSLILACGSSPFVPLADSLKFKNVFAIRTLEDAEKVHECASTVKTAVVIGGGLLGLEAANSLLRMGVDVTVVEISNRILPNQLDEEGARFFADWITRQGLRLFMGKRIKSLSGGEKAEALEFEGGDRLGADMFIFSVGIRSNTGLALDCGIKVNRAIVVNERMETSIPGIYACGDVAEFDGRTIPLWMNAVKQGRVAGLNAAGEKAVMGREIYPAVLNSFGTRVFSAEMCTIEADASVRSASSFFEDKGILKKLFFKADRLSGFYLIGDITESQKYLTGLKSGLNYGDIPASDLVAK